MPTIIARATVPEPYWSVKGSKRRACPLREKLKHSTKLCPLKRLEPAIAPLSSDDKPEERGYEL